MFLQRLVVFRVLNCWKGLVGLQKRQHPIHNEIAHRRGKMLRPELQVQIRLGADGSTHPTTGGKV